jgi:tetratricopeptide (TPR) repeat protein
MWFINLLLALAIALSPTQASEQAPVPFDYNAVRADMFAGLAGDALRFAKAMEACERALASQPKHAEALVWHGAGVFFQAGQAFQRGDMAKGGPLFDQGLAEMNEAVALAPDNLGVIIPRGAVLLQATRGMPPAIGRPLLESAVRNYEHVLELQKSYFHTLGDHPKGELLFGLAEGYARLGNQAKARVYFERLVADAPTSGQTPRGKAWLETGVVPEAKGLGCYGCHK